MIDNPLPDQVMEARDVFYNHQEVEEVIRNHAKIIAEHFKVHPDLHDEFAEWYYDFICQNPDLFQSFSINLDSDYIVDWWEDLSTFMTISIHLIWRLQNDSTKNDNQ